LGDAPEFRRQVKTDELEPGSGTALAIEGFVELGMTPMQALVARISTIFRRSLQSLPKAEESIWPACLSIPFSTESPAVRNNPSLVA
jgi:hypothetical protein